MNVVAGTPFMERNNFEIALEVEEVPAHVGRSLPRPRGGLSLVRIVAIDCGLPRWRRNCGRRQLAKARECRCNR